MLLLKAIEMIASCVRVLLPEAKKPQRAFSTFMDWIAWRHRTEPMLLAPTLRMASWTMLNQMWQPDLLQAVHEDALGAAYRSLMGKEKPVGPFLSPAEACARLDAQPNGLAGHSSLYLPGVSSGNLLFEARARFGDEAPILATEMDLTMYRMALLNNHFHHLGAWVLRADPRAHELQPSSRNWLMSNWWTPPVDKDFAKLQNLAVTAAG